MIQLPFVGGYVCRPPSLFFENRPSHSAFGFVWRSAAIVATLATAGGRALDLRRSGRSSKYGARSSGTFAYTHAVLLGKLNELPMTASCQAGASNLSEQTGVNSDGKPVVIISARP